MGMVVAIGASVKAQSGSSEHHLKNLVTGIDHVPVVVPDLNEARHAFSDLLKFTVKNGRLHEGINNFFVKFQDGTYLEFVTPVDPDFETGSFYANFLKKRAGGTSMALSVKSADSTTVLLQRQHISFKSNPNPIWNSIELPGFDLFYIEYINKSWKERIENITHPNEAMALKAVWWNSRNPTADISKFKTLGFADQGSSTRLGTKARILVAKSSELIVVNNRDGLNLLTDPKIRQTEGICGFTVQVKSLNTVMQLLGDKKLIVKDQCLVYHLEEYNFFMVFSE